MNFVGTHRPEFSSGLCVAWYDGSFLFIFITLSSAQSAVAQGNLLYMFALANTQSAQSAVALGNLLYMFARANTQSGADGHVSGTVDYDIFGEPVAETGVFAANSTIVFAYAGKPYDSVTGLSDYGFRDYAPSLARFTTVDPIRDGSNWYSYCNSDPVNYVDLWGLIPGQTFDTLNDAIYDFAILYNDDSIRDGKEYGATIYQDSNSKYYYTTPNMGTSNSVFMYTPAKANQEQDVDVAIIHTHGKFDDAEGERLSAQDKATGKMVNIPVYVVTPGGKIEGEYNGNKITVQGDNRVASDPNSGIYRQTTTDASSGVKNDSRNPIDKTIDEVLDEKDKRINMYGRKESASCE